MEVEQLRRRPGFGRDEASRMVAARPALWAKCTTEFSFMKKYKGKYLPIYFHELKKILGTEAREQGMVRIEAMWMGYGLGVDVFLKAYRHLKTIFLGIKSLLSL
ncbi:hypothetical protein AMTR_s00062p00154230 [Amborella trichopoda]|uniref:Uncharacterized protein n=1 Tax=Amborella trichopoda TaxID=13333 RepID=U5DDZ7_AMBTC|nr:hypothetical protein AMTR_s00062p00154230 [Amborella trichopoda]